MRVWELTGKAVAIAMLTMLAVAEGTVEAAQTSPADIRSSVEALSQWGGTAPRASKAAPFAQSAEIERNQAAAALGEFDPERILAPVSAEVREVWIGWYVERSIDAFRVAIERNVPLVLIVSEDWCRYCVNLANNSLRCTAVNRFAGEAVFAISSPSKDRGANAIASSLEIEAYPTITVLEPEARMLLERGRINGYFESSKLGEHLETILWKTPPRGYRDKNGVLEKPPAPWSPITRIGSELGASLGVTNRGLKHAPPQPNCK